MSGAARTYPHFRCDLVGHLLSRPVSPAEVAGWLAKDGRANLLEIGNLRMSADWIAAHRRIIGPREVNTELPGDMLWTPNGWVRRDAFLRASAPEPASLATNDAPPVQSTTQVPSGDAAPSLAL